MATEKSFVSKRSRRLSGGHPQMVEREVPSDRNLSDTPSATIFIKKKQWSTLVSHWHYDLPYAKIPDAQGKTIDALSILITTKIGLLAQHEALTKTADSEDIVADLSRLTLENEENTNEILGQQTARNAEKVDYGYETSLDPLWRRLGDDQAEGAPEPDSPVSCWYTAKTNANKNYESIHRRYIASDREDMTGFNGMIELTNVPAINTIIGLDRKGSASFELENPDDMLYINEFDVYRAVHTLMAFDSQALWNQNNVSNSFFSRYLVLPEGPFISVGGVGGGAKTEDEKSAAQRYLFIDLEEGSVTSLDSLEEIESLSKRVPEIEDLLFGDKKITDYLPESNDHIKYGYTAYSLKENFIGKAVIEPRDQVHIWTSTPIAHFQNKDLQSSVFNSDLLSNNIIATSSQLEEARDVSSRILNEYQETGIMEDFRRLAQTNNGELQCFQGIVKEVHNNYNSQTGAHRIRISCLDNMEWLDIANMISQPTLADGKMRVNYPFRKDSISGEKGLVAAQWTDAKIFSTPHWLYSEYDSKLSAEERSREKKSLGDPDTAKAREDLKDKAEQEALEKQLQGARSDPLAAEYEGVYPHLFSRAYAGLDPANIISFLVLGIPYDIRRFLTTTQASVFATDSPTAKGDTVSKETVPNESQSKKYMFFLNHVKQQAQQYNMMLGRFAPAIDFPFAHPNAERDARIRADIKLQAYERIPGQLEKRVADIQDAQIRRESYLKKKQITKQDLEDLHLFATPFQTESDTESFYVSFLITDLSSDADVQRQYKTVLISNSYKQSPAPNLDQWNKPSSAVYADLCKDYKMANPGKLLEVLNAKELLDALGEFLTGLKEEQEKDEKFWKFFDDYNATRLEDNTDFYLTQILSLPDAAQREHKKELYEKITRKNNFFRYYKNKEYIKRNLDINFLLISIDYENGRLESYKETMGDPANQPLFESEYESVEVTCRDAASALGFEFYCTTQGNLFLTPPRFNRTPLPLLRFDAASTAHEYFFESVFLGRLRELQKELVKQQKTLNEDASGYLWSNTEIEEAFRRLLQKSAVWDTINPLTSYYIPDVDVVSWDLQEGEPDATRIDVVGAEQFIPIEGADYYKAYGVHYQLWRSYGYKHKTINAPFLHNYRAAQQYLHVLLNTEEGKIFSGSITKRGDSRHQLGDVAYIEGRDMLYYVRGVQHDFTFGGEYLTTLHLAYGRRPGSYIPFPFDSLGQYIIDSDSAAESTNTVVYLPEDSQEKTLFFGALDYNSPEAISEWETLFLSKPSPSAADLPEATPEASTALPGQETSAQEATEPTVGALSLTPEDLERQETFFIEALVGMGVILEIPSEEGTEKEGLGEYKVASTIFALKMTVYGRLAHYETQQATGKDPADIQAFIIKRENKFQKWFEEKFDKNSQIRGYKSEAGGEFTLELDGGKQYITGTKRFNEVVITDSKTIPDFDLPGSYPLPECVIRVEFSIQPQYALSGV